MRITYSETRFVRWCFGESWVVRTNSTMLINALPTTAISNQQGGAMLEQGIRPALRNPQNPGE